MGSLALKAFLTLFVVMDPIGLVPVFLALAGSRPRDEQARIARKAVGVARGGHASVGPAGGWLLRNLSISMDAFRVSGGILLFLIAVDMVLAQHERETKEEEEESRARADVSVFPLAIPMIAGPGTLASLMILAAESRPYAFGLAMVLGIAAVVLALSYAAFRLSAPLARLLGRTGVNVVTRVLGVLLAALAVQYVADGARGLLGAALTGA
jgi:multiple antibiotic resistance protein